MSQVIWTNIRISVEVRDAIQADARPIIDSYDDALRRKYGLPPLPKLVKRKEDETNDDDINENSVSDDAGASGESKTG